MKACGHSRRGRWPRSILGRTLLVMFAGLLVSHAVGLSLYAFDRHNTLTETGGKRAAERIAHAVAHELPERNAGWSAEVPPRLAIRAV